MSNVGVSDEDVWTTNGNGVVIRLPGGESIEREEVTSADVKEIAKDEGIKKFVVKRNGDILQPTDFPVTSGEIKIEEYNEAK